jgi:hypothetical protein
VQFPNDVPHNLNTASKKAKFYSNELKNLNKFDSITCKCASYKDIQHFIACKQKRFGACDEMHFLIDYSNSILSKNKQILFR